jgi:hypothetical protein
MGVYVISRQTNQCHRLAMKSGKQKRLQIDARRRVKSEKKALAARKDPRPIRLPPETESAPCNPSSLAPYNSYGSPKFVERGYYIDTNFKLWHRGSVARHAAEVVV